jgi:hypothetical protein
LQTDPELAPLKSLLYDKESGQSLKDALENGMCGPLGDLHGVQIVIEPAKVRPHNWMSIQSDECKKHAHFDGVNSPGQYGAKDWATAPSTGVVGVILQGDLKGADGGNLAYAPGSHRVLAESVQRLYGLPEHAELLAALSMQDKFEEQKEHFTLDKLLPSYRDADMKQVVNLERGDVIVMHSGTYHSWCHNYSKRHCIKIYFRLRFAGRNRVESHLYGLSNPEATVTMFRRLWAEYPILEQRLSAEVALAGDLPAVAGVKTSARTTIVLDDDETDDSETKPVSKRIKRDVGHGTTQGVVDLTGDED